MAITASVSNAIVPTVASLLFFSIGSSIKNISFPRMYFHLAGITSGILGIAFSSKAKDDINDFESAKLARNEIFDIRLRNQVSAELQQINIPYIMPETPIYEVIDNNPQYQQYPQYQQENQGNSLYYNWDNLPDDAVGIILVGNSGSGKTSSACKVAEILTRNKPSHVIALDPHYNEVWELSGIQSIGNIEEIESAINWLVRELDARCERKGNKESLGPDYIVFVDEINSALERFDDKKNLESALKRLGSEGRKFGLSLIAINQSSNVNDLGISKPFRSNFLIIALRTSAWQLAENEWGDKDERTKLLKNTPYPCLVSGSTPTQLAIHLTHSTYPKFEKEGLPPIGLGSINQLPWPSYPWEMDKSQVKNIDSPITKNIDLVKSADNPIDSVVDWILSRHKKTTIRDVLTNCSTAKKNKYSSNCILYIFEKLESENKGRIIKNFSIGGKVSISFLPIGIEYDADDADDAENL